MTRPRVTLRAARFSASRVSHDSRAQRFIFIIAALIAVFGGGLSVNTGASAATRRSPVTLGTVVSHTKRLAKYPVGVIDPSEPSRYAPPLPTSLAGYHETYVNDFTGSVIPTGWYVFNGVPGGDPDGLLTGSHVRFTHGELQILTTYVPSVGKWVSGGLCQCAVGHVFGAFFVRSRITGPGPNEAELLWPQNNTWPPEIDFNETGQYASRTSSTLHYGATNLMTHGHIKINMTKWHTWGVIWSPTSVIYTVDGRVWGRNTVVANIPTIPMTLDIESRTSCNPILDCPKAPQAMQVDWVAEFARS